VDVAGKSANGRSVEDYMDKIVRPVDPSGADFESTSKFLVLAFEGISRVRACLGVAVVGHAIGIASLKMWRNGRARRVIVIAA